MPREHAERQYRAVDPDNRLIAGELERRWELALRAGGEARTPAERYAALQEQLRDLGRALPALWASGRLTPSQQQELLHSLIRRVIVTRPVPDTTAATVVGVSGAVTPITVHPPILHRAEAEARPLSFCPSAGRAGRRLRPGGCCHNIRQHFHD